MYNVREIFKQLETDVVTNQEYYISNRKLVIREMVNNRAARFFLACEPEEKRKWILVPVANRVSRYDLQKYPTCKGMDLSSEFFEEIGSLKHQWCLILEQVVPYGHSIYESFLTNYCDSIFETPEVYLTRELLRAMQTWQHFFSRLEQGGLTSEEQRGLFGELEFLNWLMEKGCSPQLIESWKGPLREDVDFLVGSIGVEVKTTMRKHPLKVRISNENQLSWCADEGGLYLSVSLLERSTGTGQSLNDIVRTIRGKCIDWPASMEKFEHLLMQAGYYSIHAEQYEKDVYAVLERRLYSIKDDFPRLCPRMLPKEITNVKYDIDLDKCELHRETELEFLKRV